MHFIFGIIVCLIVGFLFWFIGHVILKQLNLLKEDNKLLSNLLNICLGASSFLVVINFLSNILRDFNWGLILSFLIIIGIIFWQLNDFKQACLNLKDFFKKDNFQNFFRSYTDKYFWILFGIINFIYGLTAFSSTKLDRFIPGSGHVYNINQLLAGTYPPKYSFLPNISQRYHFGSDIFGAIVSKISGLHPEISLDILTLFFLNLSLLALYALTIKFLNTNPVNKYLIPFGAFLAWGPITTLFKTNLGEILPTSLLEKIRYLTQTKLIDTANWSGLTLNWFFAPPIGFSIFFFLIALYLLFRFFEGEQSLKFTLLLGVFLSSFVILDFSKFIILLLGLLVCMILKSPIPFEEKARINNPQWRNILQSLGILLFVSLALGFIHGNFLSFTKNYISFKEFYLFGKTNMDSKLGPLGANIILLGIFGFGFYQAYKQNIKWINHLIPFFAVSIIIPYLVTIPGAGGGKILICSSLLGVFTLPITTAFVQNKFHLKEEKLKIFYSSIFIFLSFSTLMFWAFGDRNKPLFTLENGKLKSTGKQIFPFDEKLDDFMLAKKLKSKNIKNSSILSESQYSELLSINSGSSTPWPISNFSESNPVKKEVVDLVGPKLNSLFTLNRKLLVEEKIHLLYLTPKLVRYMLSPQARQAILNATFKNGGKLISSNKKEPTQLKEIYYIDPEKLSYEPIKNYGKHLKEYLQSATLKKASSDYVRQIAECPYFGIYNAMSNDFDGDKIADVAFFNYDTKIFSIIYGKDEKEEEIDLKNSIFANSDWSELLVPIPSDYDGDSKTDIAFFSENTGKWYVRKSSDLQFDDGSKWFGVYLEEIPLPADVDGDGKTDLGCYNSNNGTWYSGATTKGFYENNFGLSSLAIPVYADLDGDKKADYVIYNPDKNLLEAYLSSKAFDKQQHLQLTIGSKNSRLVPEDYDGDGKVDFAVWTPESGEFEIAYAKDFLISSITSGNTPPAFVGCGIPPTQAEEGSPVPPCATKKFILGKAGDIPMPGDYDGDKKAEIAVFNRSTGKLEMILNNGSHKKINLAKYKNLTPASFIGL